MIKVFIIVFILTGTLGAFTDKIIVLPQGAQPTGLDYHDGFLWCADDETNQIYKVDIKTSQVVDSIRSPDKTPLGVAWSNGTFWVTGANRNRLFQCSPSGDTIKSFPIPYYAKGLAIIDGALWMLQSTTGHIYKIDTLSGAMIDSVDVAMGSSRGLTSDHNGFWVTNSYGSWLYKIDRTRRKVTIWVPLQVPAVSGCAWDGEGVWVCCDTSKIIRIRPDKLPDVIVYDSADVYMRSEKRYFSKNGKQATGKFRISVPYQSSGQKLIESVQCYPPSVSWVYDSNGYRFAEWNAVINPGDTSVMGYTTRLRTYSILFTVDPESVGTAEKLPVDTVKKYSADYSFLDYHNPVILSTAEKVIGTETNIYWQTRMLCDYVSNALVYGETDGYTAAEILASGRGICTHYSRVLIALLRSLGIPARYEAGQSFNLTDDPVSIDTSWHRWTEVYLPNAGWVTVDPTWENFGEKSKSLVGTTRNGGFSDFLKSNSHGYFSVSSGSVEGFTHQVSFSYQPFSIPPSVVFYTYGTRPLRGQLQQSQVMNLFQLNGRRITGYSSVNGNRNPGRIIQYPGVASGMFIVKSGTATLSEIVVK